MKSFKKLMNLALSVAIACTLVLGGDVLTASAHNREHESEHHVEYSHGNCEKAGTHVCDTIKVPAIISVENLSKGIKITWTPCDNATGYQIYRKNGTGAFKRIATVKDCCTYTDTTITCGKTYTYKIRAYEKCVNGNAYGNCCKTKTMCHVSSPIIKQITNSKKGVVICWDKPNGVTGFKVYRKCADEESYKCVKTTTACKWTDTSSTNGKRYTYKVRCYRKAKNGKTYNSVCSKVKSIKCKK